jgi:hypothetical protein
VGKVVQPLQSVNCHDSRAHGHERHGSFTLLVGYGCFGSGQVLGLDGFCYRGVTCELCLVLATGVRPVSFVWSGYRGEILCHRFYCSNESQCTCRKRINLPHHELFTNIPI